MTRIMMKLSRKKLKKL
jgi:hypothetical protein